MKKTILKFCVASLGIIGFMSMKEIAPATISGKITPADAADAVWAIKDNDTLKATVSSEGTFNVEVKPGTWKVMVSAKAPYKNAEVSQVVVSEDKNTDAGEIKLEK
ncbi:MAG: carboxypeptidase regulatory-like domain-containing protein [Ferruginibacter sp.]